MLVLYVHMGWEVSCCSQCAATHLLVYVCIRLTFAADVKSSNFGLEISIGALLFQTERNNNFMYACSCMYIYIQCTLLYQLHVYIIYTVFFRPYNLHIFIFLFIFI